MISIRAEIEKRGKFLTDDRSVDNYHKGVISGGVEATEYVLASIVKNTPVGETSTLRKGWQRTIRAGIPFQSLVFNQVPYGEIVERGSKPHEIRPRYKKALAFIPGGGPGMTTWAERLRSGETVFAKLVHHPGTKPRRFVTRTIANIRASQSWKGLWDRVIDKVLRELE